jgi:hypothetical protein
MGYITLVLGPLITGAQLEMRTELNILPAFPPSESDVIHLLERQCLLSRTVNRVFKAKQTTQNYIHLNLTTTKM